MGPWVTQLTLEDGQQLWRRDQRGYRWVHVRDAVGVDTDMRNWWV